jgi:peptidoglycan/LPS O-acetylase OafA/YrhL
MLEVTTLRGRYGRVRPDTDRTAAHRTPPHRPQPPRGELTSEVGRASAVKPRTRRLGRRPILDGLRGVAVLLVIAEHSTLLNNGFMGVDVFFVLSGFLITTLLCEEHDRFRRISLKGFYTRRARRLLPALGVLALLAIAIDVVSYRLMGWGIGEKLLTTFGFANNWVVGLGVDHNQALGALNPTWSLAQEDQFYLVWPISLVVMYRLGLKPAHILAVLIAAIAAILLLEPALAGQFHYYDAYYDPIDRFAELLLGCAGSLIWTNRMVWLPEASNLGDSLRRSVQVGVELVLGGLVAAFVILLVGVRPVDDRWVFLGAAAVTLPALLLLIQVPNTILGRVLAWAPLRAVGRISYGVYLFHLMIRNLFLHYFVGLADEHLATFAITLCVSLAMAALSYRYIEKPILQGRWPVPMSFLAGQLRRVGPTPAESHNEPATHVSRRPIRSTA